MLPGSVNWIDDVASRDCGKQLWILDACDVQSRLLARQKMDDVKMFAPIKNCLSLSKQS